MTSSEYRNISLLLSAITHSALLESPFRFLALGAFGLSYSTNPATVEALLEGLKTKLLGINAQSELIADETEAVGFAAHVLMRQNKWDRELQQHEVDLLEYFNQVAGLEWLRSDSVAMSFLLGFGRRNSFLELTEKAKEYLALRLPDPNTSMVTLPVVAFGLYQGGASPHITEMQVHHWLNRTHQQLHYLCMLTVTLKKTGQHRLAQEAITHLQEKISSVYAELVEQNVGLVGVLLSAIRMAEMGQDGDEITRSLNRLRSDMVVHDQINAVFTADSKLLVEFNLQSSANLPLVEGLSFYLFAAHQLGLTKACIIDDQRYKQYSEFARIQMTGRQFKAVGRLEFIVLVIIAFAVGVLLIIQIWWPISNALYDRIGESFESQLLVEIVGNILLQAVILVPVYFVFGAALTLWLHGQIRWSDVTKPEKVFANASNLVKSMFNVRNEG